MMDLPVYHGQLGTLTTWWKRLPIWELLTTAGLLAAGGMLAWHLMVQAPSLPYVRALGAIDQTLVQQWATLPMPAQEAFTATYSRLGLVPPGQRK